MPKYKLKSGAHTVHTNADPLVYNAGDIVDLTKEQAERFEEGRLEAVTEGGEDKAKEAAKESDKKFDTTNDGKQATDTEWTAVLSQGVNDVRGVIQALDSAEDLKALQAEETKGGNRKMVLDAIEKRLGELKK